MRFRKSEGLNASEKLLAELCEHSFLKLWTYPNLFRKPGKELTDLMVVFGNDVILFSAKACTYPNSGDPVIDWSRWFRSSIADSAKQIAKAEKSIQAAPEKVFLDAKCLEKLPIALPAAGDMRVHRICVALGALDRAEAETDVRGLKVKPSVVHDAERFTVGQISGARGWVHVFDDVSLIRVLTELTTIKDFLHYLETKAALFDVARFKYAASEADMLAYYLWNNRSFPARDVDYFIKANLWAEVEASKDFLAGREANKVSYFWDGLIDYINGHYLEETLELGNEHSMSEHEQLVRRMAGETRFHRRVLSKAILQRAELATKQAICTLLPSNQPDVNYVLYIGRGDQGKDHAAYRAERAKDLQLRCVAAKAAQPDKRFIVGIAMDARGVKGSSEDFLCWDTADWTDEDVLQAQEMRDELRWFKGVNAPIAEDEYPGSRPAIDVPNLAEELSNLTIAESAEVAAMLKAKWGIT